MTVCSMRLEGWVKRAMNRSYGARLLCAHASRGGSNNAARFNECGTTIHRNLSEGPAIPIEHRLASLTPFGDPPVLQKAIHIDVGKQWADHPTLRSPTGVLLVLLIAPDWILPAL
jgi:hypothetical protein